jgi:hypothetical protein
MPAPTDAIFYTQILMVLGSFVALATQLVGLRKETVALHKALADAESASPKNLT